MNGVSTSTRGLLFCSCGPCLRAGLCLALPDSLPFRPSKGPEPILLSSGGRLFNPTNGQDGTADQNALRSILLDDASSQQNPNPIPFLSLSGLDGTRRAGLIDLCPLHHLAYVRGTGGGTTRRPRGVEVSGPGVIPASLRRERGPSGSSCASLTFMTRVRRGPGLPRLSGRGAGPDTPLLRALRSLPEVCLIRSGLSIEAAHGIPPRPHSGEQGLCGQPVIRCDAISELAVPIVTPSPDGLTVGQCQRMTRASNKGRDPRQTGHLHGR
ncbi:hypothetical protein SAMN05443639_1294 [Stigmatella erecta]|uniref:Uncharacterized protein n=1 Tax=Stigmatella erecta TaxID=83460 RepID=A0A1I0LFG3_9BACT|nr:hypothetical protein SAMN05443639_1294 [Stigmatella erecta]